ncbi:MAG: PEGA domain-containing protein, partial [Vicinamibacterales bacterium]
TAAQEGSGLLMRSHKLFRSGASSRNAIPAEAGVDPGGLLAFAPEASSEAVITASAQPQRSRTRVTLGLLAALVVLQAAPTVLWLKGRMASAGVASAATLPVVPAPLAFAAPVPCAPPVDPAESAAPANSARPGAPAPAAPAAIPPAMVAGLLSVTAPVPMHVYVRGQLVGTTEADSIMLPVGTHELTLESTTVGYKVNRTVTVQAGRTSTLRIDAPSGTLHVNAVPWAEVWIDNQRVGETPIGNLRMPIGSREVVFRHPELGERRTTVLVTLKGPARLSMDLRAK